MDIKQNYTRKKKQKGILIGRTKKKIDVSNKCTIIIFHVQFKKICTGDINFPTIYFLICDSMYILMRTVFKYTRFNFYGIMR